ILAADLSGLVLDLADWGVGDAASLAFLDSPPTAALGQAKALLGALGAIDAAGRITQEGRRLRKLPLPPRLARMVVDAAAAGAGGAFLLANGRGANVDPASGLAREPFLAIAEIAGTAAQGRIVLAAPLGLAEIEAQFADRIESRHEIAFDEASASLRARRLRRLGALALAEQPIAGVPDETAARMLAQGIVRLGVERLPWTTALRQWRDRVLFLRRTQGDEW